MENILEIRDLGKEFLIHDLEKTIRACQGISLEVGPGEFVGITGRSGSGKSTILKSVYRTYRPQQGEIRYNSEALGPVDLHSLDERKVLYLRRYEIGYVSQFLQVIPRSTARSTIEQALVEMGHSREEAREQAEAMLRHFDLDRTLWDSYVSTFSGGEKLRVNVARAMAKKPRLLLMDEPTASLDHGSKMRVFDLLQQLKAQGTTMLGIFHDIEFMEDLCDREYAMAEGRVRV